MSSCRATNAKPTVTAENVIRWHDAEIAHSMRCAESPRWSRDLWSSKAEHRAYHLAVAEGLRANKARQLAALAALASAVSS